MTRAALSAGAGLGAVIIAAHQLRGPLVQDAAYPWRVAAIAAMVLALALAGLTRHHPFTTLGPANVLTGARTLVMALLAGMATAPASPLRVWPLVVLATVGAVADLFDGPLARRSGMASAFGARFDMEIDALLILVLSMLVWRALPIGSWILLAGLLRYGFIVAGWALPWMNGLLPSSRRRQTLCVVQIVALIVCLGPPVPFAVVLPLTAASLALLAWSFAVDIRWLHRAASVS
jgi:phosphatidylglycerophosphate synthase